MSERSTITRHALTVLAGQLAVMAFGVTDTIVAGRYSEASLAALSVGSAIFISVYVALIGVLQALLPVWAEQRGARETEGVGRSLRQALYLCGAASVAGMAILLSPGPILRWTDVPAALQPDVENYLAVLAIALGVAYGSALFFGVTFSLGAKAADYAAFAPRVVASDDAAAQAIMAQAVAEVRGSLVALQGSAALPVTFIGGLGPAYADRIPLWPRRPAAGNALDGALLLAREAA